MLLTPIENTPNLRNGVWEQVRPYITQVFGGNKSMYKRFGLEGHNGIDFRVDGDNTKIYAPLWGEMKIRANKNGYGLHVKIRSRESALECVLGHLSSVVHPKNKKSIAMGDIVGFSGNTGFSTAHHLHMGVRRLMPNDRSVWTWQVKNYGNGYYGYFDFDEFLLDWKKKR